MSNGLYTFRNQGLIMIIHPEAAATVYSNAIAELKSCKHLTGKGPETFFVKMTILHELVDPRNIITGTGGLVITDGEFDMNNERRN